MDSKTKNCGKKGDIPDYNKGSEDEADKCAVICTTFLIDKPQGYDECPKEKKEENVDCSKVDLDQYKEIVKIEIPKNDKPKPQKENIDQACFDQGVVDDDIFNDDMFDTDDGFVKIDILAENASLLSEELEESEEQQSEEQGKIESLEQVKSDSCKDEPSIAASKRGQGLPLLDEMEIDYDQHKKTLAIIASSALDLFSSISNKMGDFASDPQSVSNAKDSLYATGEFLNKCQKYARAKVRHYWCDTCNPPKK